MPYVKEVGPLEGELPKSIDYQTQHMELVGDPLNMVDFRYVEVYMPALECVIRHCTLIVVGSAIVHWFKPSHNYDLAK